MNAPAVITSSIESIRKQLSLLNRSLRADQEIVLTYHRKPLGRIVPHDRLEQEREELARLREEVEALRARLDQEQGRPAA